MRRRCLRCGEPLNPRALRQGWLHERCEMAWEPKDAAANWNHMAYTHGLPMPELQ